MLRKMLCTTTILIVLFGSVVFAQENASLSTVVEFKKYLIPKEGIQYFSDSLGSNLMELRTDGYYQSQAYNNKDKGTWQQLEDGRVRLASETRYRPIYSDDFSIMVMDKDSVVQIPAMRERLARLLAGNERNVFAIQEIVDASKYTSRDGKKSSAVSSFSVQKKFSRADITNLIAAIDAYLKDTEKNISYLMAYQYPQYGFFEDDFSSWEIPPILLEKIKGDGVKVPDGEGYIGQLNNLLKTKGLRDHFPKVQLSAEGEVLLAREDKLTEKELMRLNRLVLEAAYPKECPKGTLDRKIVFLFEGTDEFENLGGIRKKLDTGFAPQFAMRRVDKFRYDKFIRDEDEQARAFEKMDQPLSP
ncbi:MAG: hypothetical protein ACM3IL_05225, partial [Deltaproteobacteria bacterium]